jgi:hypothetical protein
LTTHLQARTVDDQVHGSWCHPIELLRDHHRGMASRQCRVIRAGKCYVHQGQNGRKEALGLPQRQAQQQPERERRLDRGVGIDRLGTSRAGLRSPPGIDGVLTDPQSDVTATAQRLVILPPIFHAIRRLVFGMSMGSFVGLCHALHRWLSGLIMSKA